MGVADANARESGLEAMRNTPGYDPSNVMQMHDYQDSPSYHQQAREGPFADPYARPSPHQEHSQSSLTPLGAAAFPPGIATPSLTASRSNQSYNNDPYSDNPYYNRHSRNLDPALIDPNSIEDDGDDGLEYRNQHRASMLSLGHNSDRAAPAVAKGAAAGGIMGALGGLVGRSASGTPQYNPVQNAAYPGPGPNDYDLGQAEKSEWLAKQSSGKKKLKWIVGILVALIIVGGIAGGVVGGILSHKKSSKDSNSQSSGSGGSAQDDTKNNGVLTKDSDEIKALLNNKNLHKVFPGFDYTPMYTQYPDCLSYPASQNNVTRDIAVISQLTNTVRLYGTDCNQTELVLEAIDNMGLNGTMKVWLGVWQDNNATTNARQLAQMYDILDTYGHASFVGIIVGNEVLFRKDMTETQLGQVISDVKSNLTSRNIDLPVASADLGDNWTQTFADLVDYVMANIHPFFAGEPAANAAAWTYSFWTNKDTPLKALDKQIISETGWPSRGGTDCGTGATTCAPGMGSIAGIPEMNTFMDSWVCQALGNGTNYFWFEAFDEPWKWKFNTPGQGWEDQWGLMDVNRNLKPGVVIPDCGGKTVS
jgi:exo-beta-1,3-glucanase (GH17 family)